MELSLVVEILILILLAIIGFIGNRVFKSLDALTIDLDRKCNDVHEKINSHAIDIATLKARIKP